MIDFEALDGIARVHFTKKNGEEREMVCTWNIDLIPTDKHPSGKGCPYDANQVRVFDLEEMEWRSFLEDSVISLETA
jgi:hypothetical protein